MQSNVTRISRLQHQLLSDEQQSETAPEDIESMIYPQIAGHPDSINSWLSDLAEIGIKAVARGEKQLGRTAAFAIADLTISYLSTRQHNLSLSVAPESMFLAVTSDVDVVTNRSYEALQEVSRAAVGSSDEATAIRVTEAYQMIALHSAHLPARAFREQTAPLTYGPVFYAIACITNAREKGLDEVVFQSAGILSKIAKDAPKDVPATDVHIPVMDGLREIAFYFYRKNSIGLAEAVNGHAFKILSELLHRQDRTFREILRHVLLTMEMLAPVAILSEKTVGRLTVVDPLGQAYGLVHPSSLGYLFETAARTLPNLDKQREWLNPYSEVIAIGEIISNHLRKIAENNELGESFVLWNINQTIKHISMVIKNLLDRPLRREHGDEEELVNRLVSILAFYWVAFREKKTINDRRANECCDSLAYIGLAFFESGYSDVLSVCVSNIHSIVESYCETTQPVSPYTIGDFFAYLWGCRIVLVAKNQDALVEEVDKILSSKPLGLSDEKWLAAQEAIMRRRRQLEERLAERDDYLSQRDDSSEFMVRRLM